MTLTQFHCHLMSYFNAVNLKAHYDSEAAFTFPNLFQESSTNLRLLTSNTICI